MSSSTIVIPPELKAVHLKSKAVKRLTTEYHYYGKEVAEYQDKIDSLHAKQAEAYDIRKAKEFLDESISTQENVLSRLDKSFDEFDKIFKSFASRNDLVSTEAYGEILAIQRGARDLLNSKKKSPAKPKIASASSTPVLSPAQPSSSSVAPLSALSKRVVILGGATTEDSEKDLLESLGQSLAANGFNIVLQGITGLAEDVSYGASLASANIEVEAVFVGPKPKDPGNFFNKSSSCASTIQVLQYLLETSNPTAIVFMAGGLSTVQQLLMAIELRKGSKTKLSLPPLVVHRPFWQATVAALCKNLSLNETEVQNEVKLVASVDEMIQVIKS